MNNSARSPCPTACTLDLPGDKWTLLVVRDLLPGRPRTNRYKSHRNAFQATYWRTDPGVWSVKRPCGKSCPRGDRRAMTFT